MSSFRHEVIIVGGGPAGSAAALALARRDRVLADRCLLLDAAVFPRDKLCAGGLLPQTDRLLEYLGVAARVPSLTIREVCLEYDGGRSVLRRPHLFRVVHRPRFDHALLQAAAAGGIPVHEGEAVLGVTRERNAIRVDTERGVYRAQVVIGADGASSRVRRALIGPARGERFVALEVTTPGHDRRRNPGAIFDFRPVAEGLRGYAWHFPALQGGVACTVRGIGGTRWPAGISLRERFARMLGRRGIAPEGYEVRGWSLPFFDPRSPQSAERVLLAGDAVGVESWLGEGISGALGTGILAAHAAADGLTTGRLAFGDYRERLRESAVGWILEYKRSIAAPFYEAAAKPRGLAAFLSQEAMP